MVPTPRWISRLVADAIHYDTIKTHGGLAGLRDENLLESALSRPLNRQGYEPASDLADLAAAYGYGIARDHPYHDGNKRVAFMVMATFTEFNRFELDAPEPDVVAIMQGVAAGEVDEPALAQWVRDHLLAL